MREYQGHRSWNAWNVSLYISNEYHLYRMVMDFYHQARKLGHSHERAIIMAANAFMRRLGGTRTPDGAIYNGLCVRLAIADLVEDCADE